MAVNVTNINPDNISGNSNGYSYDLLQVIPESATFLYKLTDPDENTRIAELGASDLGQLTSDPETFWRDNVEK